MKGAFKVPLIIAAILVVGRVLLERAGAPETINNLLSVVVLYVLVVPLSDILTSADFFERSMKS